jgi:UDP-N-acetylmuramate dehydrogenase
VSIKSIHFQEHIPLAPYTTLGIGGAARYFCEAAEEAALLVALHFAHERQLEVFILGGGSNLLISDKGFDGLVIRVTVDSKILTANTAEALTAYVPAGLDWNAFVLEICKQGISGIECLAGIPGLVGGSPIQNIGAYGQEVADTIESVRALDLGSLRFVDLPKADCGFAYRRSIFNSTHRNRYIVTEVTFRFDRTAKPNLTYADLKKHFAHQLASGETPTPLDIYHAVRAIRHTKGMLIVPGEPDTCSAGSFFKNPIVPAVALTRIAQTLKLDPGTIPHWPAPDHQIKLPAAWLLDQAGFHKGFTMGRAGISSRHTLALINRGGASFADITALRDRIIAEVQHRFQISLEQEPVQLGA